MTNPEKTKQFLESIPFHLAARILDSIAAHYGISQIAAQVEVTDPEAEHLCDYIADTGLRSHAAFLMASKGLF